jgi:hypothetical protein
LLGTSSIQSSDTRQAPDFEGVTYRAAEGQRKGALRLAVLGKCLAGSSKFLLRRHDIFRVFVPFSQRNERLIFGPL